MIRWRDPRRDSLQIREKYEHMCLYMHRCFWNELLQLLFLELLSPRNAILREAFTSTGWFSLRIVSFDRCTSIGFTELVKIYWRDYPRVHRDVIHRQRR